MPIENIIINCLADLRLGDRIKSWDGHKYDPPPLVIGELGPIEPGSPVKGVRLQNPRPESGLVINLYPSQMDGRTLEVDRYVP